MNRRTALLAGLVTLVARPALSQGSGGGRFWFDPTQLPSFTGVVERYLLTPEGKTDRLVFREGPQVLFPEHVADAIMAAVPPGRSIIVFGIRARRAPVITLLAWARDGESQPRFVDRPSWTFPEFRAADERLEAAGTIRMPLYTPQGDVIGAVLDEGVVIRLPAGVAQALGDRLAPGRPIAAAGHGATVPGRGKALDADRLGDSAEKLEPLPAPVLPPQSGG
ncbi:hypothetical protein J8J14_14960 [Roseomonas sp. SSH11]|uniref:Uncharacterized protein n=1 Tax=Pararoseomonas baculiformis TaxID=2820812 RepID=A0ABS4AGE5_9PROT|nr:hypothetical protein [Pararoseomonas baculiformis]MBP0446073.1 hypothetical protein [Pararoseomonas baculiformis]